MIDYRYKKGVVGIYKGNDIFVIPKKDFTIELSKQNKDYIYAISNLDEDKLALVNRGMLIGYMSSAGKVEMLKKSEFYSGDDAMAANEDSVLEVTSASGKITDDYLAGETLADRFIRQFGQW